MFQDFSTEMCPPGRCSTSKEGLIQTAFVVVYMLVRRYFNFDITIVNILYNRRLLQCSVILVTATPGST